MYLKKLCKALHNFFKYMVESFGIDSITSYCKNPVPDTSSVINPEYRELDRRHKK